jgi:hypothetical protein
MREAPELVIDKAEWQRNGLGVQIPDQGNQAVKRELPFLRGQVNVSFFAQRRPGVFESGWIEIEYALPA